MKMNISVNFIFYILYFIFFQITFSFVTSPEYVLNNYELITPSLKADTYAKPMKFAKSNNLTQKTGSYFLAKGKIIEIEGNVIDILGSPVEGAKIEIWQANNYGYYNYLVDNEDYSKYDEDFESTGTFITSVDGYYKFRTIIPGTYGVGCENNSKKCNIRAPHIHFSVSHNKFPALESEIFLEGHPGNISDVKFVKINKKQRQLLQANISDLDAVYPIYKFNIRLNGILRNKK